VETGTAGRSRMQRCAPKPKRTGDVLGNSSRSARALSIPFQDVYSYLGLASGGAALEALPADGICCRREAGAAASAQRCSARRRQRRDADGRHVLERPARGSIHHHAVFIADVTSGVRSVPVSVAISFAGPHHTGAGSMLALKHVMLLTLRYSRIAAHMSPCMVPPRLSAARVSAFVRAESGSPPLP